MSSETSQLLTLRMGEFLRLLRSRGRGSKADVYELTAIMVALVHGVDDYRRMTVEEVLVGLRTPPIPPGYSHFYWGKAVTNG